MGVSCIPLSEYSYKKGMPKPQKIIMPDLVKYVDSWSDVLYRIAEWIVKNNYIEKPIASGTKNYIINYHPCHISGRKFRNGYPVGKMWVDVGVSPTICIRNIMKLIDYAKLDASEFLLYYNNELTY